MLQGKTCVTEWIKLQIGDFDEKEVEVPEGQPFNLKLLHLLLREQRDADAEIVNKFKTGVTAGILYPLPRTPAIYEEQTKWRLPEHPWFDRECSADNYSSLDKHVEAVRKQFLEEQELGLMQELTDEAFYERFRENHAISSLAVIEEDGGQKIRVLHDGTHVTCINNRIRQRDKLRMPGVAEAHTLMRERRHKSQFVMSLLGDFTKAHRWTKILPEEQGLLACRLENTYGSTRAEHLASHQQRTGGAD